MCDKDKEGYKSPGEILGEKEHSWLLLGTLNVTNGSHSFLNSGRRIVETFKEAVKLSVPDYSNIPVEEMTSAQVQTLTDKGNVLARADSLLDEINNS